MTELREKGEKSAGGGGGADSVAQSQTMMNLNVQLKSTMKAHARVSQSTTFMKVEKSFIFLNQTST